MPIRLVYRLAWGRFARKAVFALRRFYSVLALPLLLVNISVSLASAEPIIPSAKEETVESIPTMVLNITAETSRLFDQELAKNMQNAEEILALVEKCLREAQINSSPRYLGYAYALLEKLTPEARASERARTLSRTLEAAFAEYVNATK